MNEYENEQTYNYSGTPESTYTPDSVPAPEPESAPVYRVAPAATEYTQPSQEYRPTPPAPEPPKPKKKRGKKPMGAGGIIALCLICSLLAAFFSSGVTYLSVRSGRDSAVGRVIDEIVPTAAPQVSVNAAYTGAVDVDASHVYDLARQQVVGITTEITYYNFFGQASSASVTGSGFIIDADGYILTNNHVIEDAYKGGYEVSVLMHDGTAYTAEIVGVDKDNDIAVLKIDAEGLVAAELGDSDSVTVGQVVYAVGNPLGELNYTMTTGIVSATDRAITTEADSVPINMFQMDAAVNSGNSGGPVYNSAGQVIGVVTAKTSATGVEGLGFAIPISDAAHIANQILEYGYVTDRASLGIGALPVTSTMAEYYNMVEGAYVRTVNEGSAAEKAGLQVGDIITAVDDQEVAGATELTAIVRSYHVGDTAQLTVWRNGEELTLTVTFDQSLPQEEEEPDRSPSDQPPQGYGYGQFGGDIEDFFRQFFGFGF